MLKQNLGRLKEKRAILELFDYQTTLPYIIEDVFDLTVDLECAPYWHSIFSRVEMLTSDPIGLNSQWNVHLGPGSFDLQITEFVHPYRAVFSGTTVHGFSPNFTIEMAALGQGTFIHYLLHPQAPKFMRPLLATFAPAYGRCDLDRYFREMHSALAAFGQPKPAKSR